MAAIEQYQQSDGTYVISTKDLLVESDVGQVIETVKSVYQRTQPTYLILNLEGNYVLPIRALASEIRRFYLETNPSKAPLFIAILVEASIAQVIETVVKTLMQRDAIQPFTEMKPAKQWLMLERMKQQKVKDIGATLRGAENN